MWQAAPLRRFGAILQAKSACLLIALTVGLLVLCVFIKSVKIDAELSSWIQQSSRVENELNYISSILGEGTGSSSLLVLQTPRQSGANALTVESLMVHIEAMAIASQVTIDLYDVSWNFKDLCFIPTIPDFEGAHVNRIMDNMMPCVIKTPLACFWEGAKLHVPDQTALLSSLDPIHKWTSFDPLRTVEKWQRSHPHASFPYSTLLDWMRRVGIKHGYQFKPCLDPLDFNCPDTAPNKLSREPPNIGAILAGGCHGIAENQMHWREEEIVGSVMRNKSGHIVHASALQSTIQLMGEQDMYDYWRKTNKVQDVNNWSTEKAKIVLDTWQTRFKEELDRFTETFNSSRPYYVHAITSESMLEPLDARSVLDINNALLSFIIMAVFTCTVYPNFKILYAGQSLSGHSDKVPEALNRSSIHLGHLRRISLALVSSLFIGLVFIASLGVSSFMNLPLNMATTQILPPLAFYYGFQQYTMIANIYAQKFRRVRLDELTISCLGEIIPAVGIEFLLAVVALLAAAIIPIPATRVFAFQAIIYIVLTSLSAIILIPSMLTNFLIYNSPQLNKPLSHGESSKKLTPRVKTGRNSPAKFLMCSRREAKETKSDEINLEDHILSRIQDDLKNIRADSCGPTDINFSAHLGAEGIHTSFNLTAYKPLPRPNVSQVQTTKSSLYTSEPSISVSPKADIPNKTQESQPLPDFITSALSKSTETNAVEDSTKLETGHESSIDSKDIVVREDYFESNPVKIYSNILTSNKFLQLVICLVSLSFLVVMVSQISRVKYGSQLRDVVARGTSEYDSFSLQEEHFPIYNVFAITKGNFDYPTNQALLHRFYESLLSVDGVLGRHDTDHSKFWLTAFRSWLLNIQSKFDIDRRNSAISIEGWVQDVSEETKLAYKLLVQTGKPDNPIDKNLVETNRLVDLNGIINPKAFYHYLAAWVMNDPFTYATSEAMFKPEPKIWNGNPNDLRVEKARPLVYAQIPLLLKLPADDISLETISKMRSISEEFEKLNLPNFPTGIPFIFWDQYVNQDILLILSIPLLVLCGFAMIGLALSDFTVATVIMIQSTLTLVELYGFMGIMSIPLNNILAFLLISTSGLISIQNAHYTTCYKFKRGDAKARVRYAIQKSFQIITTSLVLFFLSIIVIYFSKIDFMIKYSQLLFFMAFLNMFNSLFLTPVMLSMFGSTHEPAEMGGKEHQVSNSSGKSYRPSDKSKHRVGSKKRNYPRVQSEISLSTISEEPQTEAHVHDLKFDFSIRCY